MSSIIITLRVTPEEKESIQRAANALEISAGELIRRAIAAYLSAVIPDGTIEGGNDGTDDLDRS